MDASPTSPTAPRLVLDFRSEQTVKCKQLVLNEIRAGITGSPPRKRKILDAGFASDLVQILEGGDNGYPALQYGNTHDLVDGEDEVLRQSAAAVVCMLAKGT